MGGNSAEPAAATACLGPYRDGVEAPFLSRQPPFSGGRPHGTVPDQRERMYVLFPAPPLPLTQPVPPLRFASCLHRLLLGIGLYWSPVLEVKRI